MARYRIFVLASFSLAALGQRVQVDIASHQQPPSTLAPSQALASVLLMMDPLHLARSNHRSLYGKLNSHNRISSSSGPQMKEEMKTSVRKLPKSAISLDIEVPSELEAEIHMKVLKDFAKDADIPGFRKKKGTKGPPPALILQHVGPKKVKAQTIQQIVDMSLKSTGVTQHVQVIGQARLPETMEKLVERYNIGEGISYTLEVDVMPEVPIDNSTYKGLSVTVNKEPFNIVEYEKALMTLRKKYIVVEDLPEGTAADLGQQIIVNMNGFFANADGTKGSPLPSLASGESVTLKMESGAFMPGLVEGVVGIKAGEVRDIKTKFPTRASTRDVQTLAIQNRDVIFEMECLVVQSLTLPEVNEEFADRVKPGMTLKEMEDKLKEGVNQQSDDALDARTNQALTEGLLAKLPEDFEVPDTIVNSIIKEQFAEMLAQQRDEGKTDEQLKALVSEENYKTFSKIMVPKATQRVKADLAFEVIAAMEGLQVSRADVDEEIMNQQMRAAQAKQKFKESEVRPRVEEKMQQNMVLDFLKSFASISYREAKDDGQTSMKEALGETPEELAARMKDESMTEDALREQLELRDATLKGE